MLVDVRPEGRCGMNSKCRIAALATVLGSVVWLGCAAHLAAQENSHVRIVRLSFAEGTVSVQRPEAKEWATAPANTPIQDGFKLSTEKDSFAEVEFENGSTARIGEVTLLEFTDLSLTPSGAKVNRMTLGQGYATFHVTPEAEDVYEVSTGPVKLTPEGKAEFRADLDGTTLRVEVFKGVVDFSGPEGTVSLAKNKVLETEIDSQEAYEVTHGITKDSWDEWVQERDEVQASNRAPSAYSQQAAGTNYGWADLYNYGSWSYLSGMGYGWIPVVYAGWSPYSLGRWTWYPGFGYTWISYEPWGWLPYHYGNWMYDASIGWAWFPGSFGAWCPAQVNWYQGPGWIGWAPSWPGIATGGFTGRSQSAGCSQAPGCIKGVPVEAFQSGKAVTPTNVMAVEPSKAARIPAPDIPPTLQTKLTGMPLSGATIPRANTGRAVQAFPAGPPVERQAAPRASSLGSRSGAAAFSRPAPPPNPVTRSAPPSTGWGFTNPGFATASRPAPRSLGSASVGATGGSGSSAAPRSGGTSVGGGGARSGGMGAGGGASHGGGGGSHR